MELEDGLTELEDSKILQHLVGVRCELWDVGYAGLCLAIDNALAIAEWKADSFFFKNRSCLDCILIRHCAGDPPVASRGGATKSQMLQTLE